jgi:hypothetical protein
MITSPETHDTDASTRVAIGAFVIATAVPMFNDVVSFGGFLGVLGVVLLLILSFGAGINQTRSSRPLRIGALFAPAAVVYFFARLGLAFVLFDPSPSTRPNLEWILSVRTKLVWMSAAAFVCTALVAAALARRRKVRPDLLLILIGCLAGPFALADIAGMALEVPLDLFRPAFVVLLLWVIASCLGMIFVAFGRQTTPRIPTWRERFYGWMSVASGCASLASLALTRSENHALTGMDVYHLRALAELYGAQGQQWTRTLAGVAMVCSLAIVAGGCRVLLTSSPRQR